MGDKVYCGDCKWLRTVGSCDQYYHYCGLDEEYGAIGRIRRWKDRANNEGMRDELDGTCVCAEPREQEPKPCPFCGGEAQCDSNNAHNGDRMEEFEWFAIYCPNCLISTTHYDTPGEALRVWNRRAR